MEYASPTGKLLRSGGPTIDSSMLTPLVLTLIATHAYFAILVICGCALLIERRLAALMLHPEKLWLNFSIWAVLETILGQLRLCRYLPWLAKLC